MLTRISTIVIVVLAILAVAALANALTEPTLVTGGSHPTISPDGQWLAFQSGGQIYRMTLPGGSPELLVTYGFEPDWSADGNLISLLAGGLFIHDLTTHETTLLHDGVGWDDGPDWSPLGNEIAVEGTLKVISYPGGVLSSIPCITPDGGDCQGESPTWSPDGGWLAFENGFEILKVRRSGGQAEAVVAGLRDVAYPAWSPDGNWIAFCMETEARGALNIWVADARGIAFGLLQLTDGEVYDRAPTWHPGGGSIYFESNRGYDSRIWRVAFDASLPAAQRSLGSVKALFR